MNVLKQNCRWLRSVAVVSCLAMTVPSFGIVSAQESSDVAVYQRFDEISALRANGEFDRAIEILKGIVEEYSTSDDILRRAYNDLVFTILSKRSAVSDSDRAALDADARARAEEALRRFPDLEADRHYFPAEINRIYDGLRAEMYGELNVATNPDECRVFIDDEYRGTSPLQIAYFPAGSHRLTISRSGFTDRVDSVTVIPGGVVQREISLSRERNRRWWAVRIGPIAAGSALIFLLGNKTGDNAPPPTEEPLPGPPPPPAR